ncbi:hypothetical protein C4571_00525 [Candidatus Parcubacteria bacterium]|nr:MAG: hypothetical protein C4571_00525 [Candidatus Parcubacteria bacterium]
MIERLQALAVRFWAWYNKFYALNLTIAAGLFLLQIVHLYWLTTDVVLFRIFGESFFFSQNPVGRLLLILVDYTEIPALITTSLVYINSIRGRGKNVRDILYLLFINAQWFHIFWITDEVVVEIFGRTGAFPRWHPLVAWAAIVIDYLELPVIYDTIKRVLKLRLEAFRRDRRIP